MAECQFLGPRYSSGHIPHSIPWSSSSQPRWHGGDVEGPVGSPHKFLCFYESMKGRQGSWEGRRKRREVGGKPKKRLVNLGSSLGFLAVVM